MCERQQSGRASNAGEGTKTKVLRAMPDQLFTGHTVDRSTNALTCTGCQQRLHEGAPIWVAASRGVESTTWSVARCYCEACAPTTITIPTLGTREVLLQAWLGTISSARAQAHTPCLTDVACIASSPPAEGSRP